MNNIKIDSPYLFLLIIPLLIIVFIGFFKMKHDKKKVKNIISLFLHIIMSIILVLSISNIRIYQSKNNTQVIVLSDVSYSNMEQYNLIDKTIAKIKNKADSKTKVGVVTYARNSEFYIPFNANLKSVAYSNVDKGATNLEGALKYAASLYSDNVNKKLIILSDGQETDNKALNQLENLINNNIYVDAIYLKRENYENEIQINTSSFTKKTYLNKKEQLKLMVQSGFTTSVHVDVYLNDELYKSEDENLIKGINVLNIDLDTSKSAINNYMVEVSALLDTCVVNNNYYFTQEVVDNYKIMIVGTTYNDCYNLTPTLSDESCEIDYFFNGEDIPYKEHELVQYDEIILSNINILSLRHYDEFIVNLEKFVAKYGKSLITNGVTYSSGTSDEIVRKYNNLLPIQCENSDTKALALVIDASTSMTFDDDKDRLEKAKEGAIACLDLLSEKDYVTVVTFGEKTNIIQPLTSLRNKDEIINNIKTKVKTSAATNMTSGIQAGYNQIRNVTASKSMIVLTDGQPSELDYQTSLPKIVSQMAKNEIYVSFININCSQGEALLKNLAKIGLGEYYFIRSSEDVVEVILTSVADNITNAIVEEDTKLELHSDKLLNGITSLPNIKGYNYSRLKNSASSFVTAVYENEQGGVKDVPICAYWQFGKGKVFSFASDLTSSWTEDLLNSNEGKKLFTNIKEYLKPSERIDSIFDVKVTNKGFSSEINIQVEPINENDYIELNIIYPSGKKSEMFLQSKVGRYNFVIMSDECGIYNLEINYHYQNKVISSVEYFSFNYSKEYDMFETLNKSLLDQLTSKNGKTYEEFDEEMLLLSRDQYYYESLNLYLLIALGVLFMLDVIVRSIKK